jgi:hypothetical protein
MKRRSEHQKCLIRLLWFCVGLDCRGWTYWISLNGPRERSLDGLSSSALGWVWASLCARRTSTFLSCAFREQEEGLIGSSYSHTFPETGHLAALHSVVQQGPSDSSTFPEGVGRLFFTARIRQPSSI